MPWMDHLSRYRKAIVALVGVVATWALGEWPDSEEVRRWASLASAFVTFAGVYLVPNDAPGDEPADPGMSERGAGVVDVLIVVVLIVLVVWLLKAAGVVID